MSTIVAAKNSLYDIWPLWSMSIDSKASKILLFFPSIIPIDSKALLSSWKSRVPELSLSMCSQIPFLVLTWIVLRCLVAKAFISR